MSFVSRSTARSTGRPSASAIGVRPAAFISSSFAPAIGEELHHLDDFGLRASRDADRDVHDRVSAVPRRHDIDMRIELVGVCDGRQPSPPAAAAIRTFDAVLRAQRRIGAARRRARASISW